MRLEYDARIDSAYLFLVDKILPGAAATTLNIDPSEINGHVNIDLDSAGRIIGIEVLDASRLLPAEFMKAMLSQPGHPCPVCGFADLHEPAWANDEPSFEICVSCGTQFGYQDAEPDLARREERHLQLRAEWVEAGYPWASITIPAPTGWDGRRQLAAMTPRSVSPTA